MRELIAKQYVALMAVTQYFDNKEGISNAVDEAMAAVQMAREDNVKLCSVILDAESSTWRKGL